MTFWVVIVIVLIFFSGYMAFRAMQAERKLEQEFIEKEGMVYIQRMQEEREKREKRKRESE